MTDKYDCITFHTSACDNHYDRVLNVHGPDGLDDECPVCEVERLTADSVKMHSEIRAMVSAWEKELAKNEHLQARVEALEAGISKALEFSSLPDTPHLKLIIKQLRALAATEQGESDE